MKILTKEKQLSKILKDAWPYYFERVEPKYKGGIPDVLMCDDEDKPFFVELKIAKLIEDKFGHKRHNKVKIDIRTSQKIWHRQYPGKSYLLIAMNGKFYLVEKRFIQFMGDNMFAEILEISSSVHSENIYDIIRMFKYV